MTGGKLKFAQITRVVNLNLLKLQGEIFHEGPKPKNL